MVIPFVLPVILAASSMVARSGFTQSRSPPLYQWCLLFTFAVFKPSKRIKGVVGSLAILHDCYFTGAIRKQIRSEAIAGRYGGSSCDGDAKPNAASF